MFRLALSSHIYFLLFKTPIVTLWFSCAPKHVLWQRVFRSASEFKVRNLILWTGHFAIYVRWLFGWRYMSSLHSTDELQQERNSCSLLRSCFIGSCYVVVSKRFSRGISLAVFAFIHSTGALSPSHSRQTSFPVLLVLKCHAIIAWFQTVKD